MSRLPLRARDGTVVAHALVDDIDGDWARQWTWRLHSSGYARRGAGKRGVYVYLHRALLGLTPGDGLEGDHIDGDRLNYHRENLRIVTHVENMQNRRYGYGSSRHRGVSWNKANRKWVAYADDGGRPKHLGSFHGEQEAAKAASDFRAKHMTHSIEEAA